MQPLRFRPDKQLHHTHVGSLGNLCNDRVADHFDRTWQTFGFDRVAAAEKALTD